MYIEVDGTEYYVEYRKTVSKETFGEDADGNRGVIHKSYNIDIDFIDPKPEEGIRDFIEKMVEKVVYDE